MLDTCNKSELLHELTQAVNFLDSQKIPYSKIWIHEEVDEIPYYINSKSAGIYAINRKEIHITVDSILKELAFPRVFDVMNDLFQEHGFQLTYINYAAWVLFHELGHYYYYAVEEKDYDCGQEEEKLRMIGMTYGGKSYEFERHYRLLSPEYDADIYAFDLFKKYKDWKEETQ